MRQRHSLWAVTFALLGALFLSACGSDDTAKSDDTKKAEDKALAKKMAKIPTVTPICPQVAIVRDVDTLRDYGRETPAPGQLVAAGKLITIDGDCEYQEDGVDVAFNLNMLAKRGPRLGGRHTSFPIFVAVVDPSGTILNKDMMTVGIDFASDANTENHAEALHVFIPLPHAQQSQGPYYRVLSGFQLSEDQVQQNKKTP